MRNTMLKYFLHRLSKLSLLFVYVGLLTAGCTIATIRPLDAKTGKAIIGDESQQFNAATLAAQLWDSQVISTLQSSAAPVDTLLSDLRANESTASEKYGHRPGETQPYSFMVTGTGKVIDVNTTSRAGMATLDINSDDQPELSLAIGPVIRGTALRDAMPFISFNQFTNQMDYAAVSNQLNALVNQKVLTPLGDVQSLKGKTVNFYGTFTLGTQLDTSNIVVTPVILTVTG
jgi:predicted lipoprotein